MQLQAFFQIPCTNTRWIQGLHQGQGFFERRSFYHFPFGEGQIIHNALEVAAQVPRFVQIANDVISQFPRLLGGIQQTQLRMQPLKKGCSPGKRDGFVLDIGSLVAGTQPVVRRLVIEVVIEIEVIEGFALLLCRRQLILFPVVFRAFFQRRIRLQLLLDAHFQFGRGQLQQLHQLNLLRR